jgi:hypothetical protein
VASKITKTLDLLGDGKWHDLDEMQTKMELTQFQVKEIIAFLSEYGFVKTSKDEMRAKVSRNLQEFLVKTQMG